MVDLAVIQNSLPAAILDYSQSCLNWIQVIDNALYLLVNIVLCFFVVLFQVLMRHLVYNDTT